MTDHAHDEAVPEPADGGGPEPFLVALEKAVRPEVKARAADVLAEVIASVHEHAKKGSLTLKLDLTPMKNNPDVVEVSSTVKGSPAEATPIATPMWPTEDGRLERNDPRQTRLPIGPRPVDREE